MSGRVGLLVCGLLLWQGVGCMQPGSAVGRRQNGGECADGRSDPR